MGLSSVLKPLSLGESVALAAILLTGYIIYVYPLRQYRLLFKNVPGPKSTSVFWGNTKELITAPPLEIHEKWMDEYGPSVRYATVMGGTRFATIDPRAVGHVLNDTDTFPKSPIAVRQLGRLLGKGLLVVQHEIHHRQRRILAPAFGPAAIRALDSVVWDKAYLLNKKFMDFLETDDPNVSSAPTGPAEVDKVSGARKVDVEKYLAEMTLDVIGLAGFGYEFESLLHANNELNEAYAKTFSHGQKITLFTLLQRLFPVLSAIPTEQSRLTDAGRRMTEELGRKIVEQKQQEMEKGAAGKDLLSLLMRANSSPDVKPEDRLDDAMVIAQICTFMLAGNETSSTALTWCLWRLALNPDIQNKLREEVRAVQEEQPSLDTLYKLPYLDNVVHESLRLDAPVPITTRMAAVDTTIPLSLPHRDRNGKTIDSITVNKGTIIDIPIMTMHRSKEIWGPDAREFNPDRWNDGTPKEAVVQGSVYGPLLTFLAGPRNCIGYRLALAEIKVTLFVLLRNFSFEILPSDPKIIRQQSVVQRPTVVGEEVHGNQMPLLMRILPEE